MFTAIFGKRQPSLSQHFSGRNVEIASLTIPAKLGAIIILSCSGWLFTSPVLGEVDADSLLVAVNTQDSVRSLDMAGSLFMPSVNKPTVNQTVENLSALDRSSLVRGRIDLNEDAFKREGLSIVLSRHVPYLIDMTASSFRLRWDEQEAISFNQKLPGNDVLQGTPFRSISFGQDRQNELEIRHADTYRVAITSIFTPGVDQVTIGLSFEPIAGPAITATKIAATQSYLPPDAEPQRFTTRQVSEPCAPALNDWIPQANNTGCKALDPSPDSVPRPSLIARTSTSYPALSSAVSSKVVSNREVSNNSEETVGEPQNLALTADIPRPRPEDYVAAVAMPDRWRILQSLGPLNKWYDPYNQNTLKADFPVKDDWFFNVTAISDTFSETRSVPTPVGLQSTAAPGSNDVFGGYDQSALVQNIAFEFVYYQGDTIFKPVDWEFRFTPVFNFNYTRLDEILGVNADPGEGKTRKKTDIGIQSAFVDKHLRNVSDNYDFDSVRVGIQPFSSDFRGFLFQDAPFGVRLFGNRSNNKVQYNVAWFRRLEKDVNSGLNDVSAGLRDDDLFLANIYFQDLPTLGFTTEILLAYNRNREKKTIFDDNNFIARPASLGLERPRTYDVYYVGLGGDGHFGRLNLTSMLYWVTGKEDGGVFTDADSDVNGLFFAAEPSIDFDWARLKFSMVYASGDSDPYDDKSEAFDAVFENPIFAGADTSYWIRQAVPLIGGGRVALSSRNGMLNSMRSSKELGQSNFTNPGLILVGTGLDLDLLPQLRLSFNANYLAFADTEVLEIARATREIDKQIGIDVSAALIWRPLMTQNAVARLSFAKLFAGDGFEDLYGNEDPYSLLANVVLTW